MNKTTTLKRFTCVGTVLVALVFMCGCSKEHENNTSVGQTSKTYINGSTEDYFAIAHAKNDSTATFYFNKDIYESFVGILLEQRLGGDYVFEDIVIIDKDPGCIDSIAALKQTLFNIVTGETVSLFSFLEKDFVGDETLYYTNTDNPDKKTVSCVAKDCGDGCKLNEKNDGCTACGNNEGSCTKTETVTIDNSNDITWKDVIGWTLTLLKLLSDILK